MGHPSFGMTVAIRKVTGTNRKDGSRLWGREMGDTDQTMAAQAMTVAQLVFSAAASGLSIEDEYERRIVAGEDFGPIGYTAVYTEGGLRHEETPAM